MHSFFCFGHYSSEITNLLCGGSLKDPTVTRRLLMTMILVKNNKPNILKNRNKWRNQRKQIRDTKIYHGYQRSLWSLNEHIWGQFDNFNWIKIKLKKYYNWITGEQKYFPFCIPEHRKQPPERKEPKQLSFKLFHWHGLVLLLQPSPLGVHKFLFLLSS